MTTSDDAYMKLANVQKQLGEERTKNDKLRLDYDNLLDDYTQLKYESRDAYNRIKLLEEKLEDIKNGR